MYPTYIQMSDEARQRAVGYLQNRLVDAIDLMLQTKVAHWNVKGSNFISLHLLFDEVNEKTRKIVDRIAERITQLGGIANGDCDSVAENSSLPDYPLNLTEGRDHIIALCQSMSVFAKFLKDGIQLTEEIDDPVTNDVLVESCRTVDKYLWFVEAHIQNEDVARKPKFSREAGISRAA